MSEIIKEKLYLGGIDDANDLNFIIINKIDVIITTAHNCVISNEVKNKINYYQFDIIDKPTFNIREYLDKISLLIENQINQGKRVLIHCWSGVSRSVCCTIAYLMIYKKMCYLDAFRIVFNQRPFICMNDGFVEQLDELELKLYGVNSA